MSQYDYDLIVIGTGPGSGGIPFKCKKAGWKVAIVESRPVGGTCALRGCTPKKLLLAAPEAYDIARRLKGKGFNSEDFHLSWKDMKSWTDGFIDKIPVNNTKKIKDAGIDLLQGHAKMASDHELYVDDKKYSFGKLVIASGAEPSPLGIEGEENVLSSDDFFTQEDLSGHIVFIGGGYISMEFAHIAKRVGCDVTVLQRGPHILKGFETQLADRLKEVSESLGIKVLTESAVCNVKKVNDNEFSICINNDSEKPMSCTKVFHGGGRRPKIFDMDLETGNVAFGKNGVSVDEKLQSTTNPNVYASGDCADNGTFMLTSTASADTLVIADQFLGDKVKKRGYEPLPSVAFTIPQLASVGMTTEQAEKSGLNYKRNYFDKTTNFFSYRVNGDAEVSIVLVDKDTDKILGAHLLGYDAGELINLFALAMRHNLTATQVRETIMTYPSHGNSIRSMLSTS